MSRLRQTHTFAVLELSQSAFAEIKAKLVAADYKHAFIEENGKTTIDMHGIGVFAAAPVIAEGHPESICDDCGANNVVWFAPSGLWNQIVRKQNQSDPMLCPRCFIIRAEALGIKHVWKVEPENVSS